MKAIKAPPITEKQFQEQIFDLAHAFGWAIAHFRPARTKYGWATPVAGDGKGFPDCVLAKEGHPVIFAEIKRKGGKLSLEQQQWIEMLKLCPGVMVFVWYSEDIDQIVEVLK